MLFFKNRPRVKTTPKKGLDQQTMLENVFKVRHSFGQDHPHYASSLPEMVSQLDRKPKPLKTLPDMVAKDVDHLRSQKIQGWETIGGTHLSTVKSAYASLVNERRQHKGNLERRLGNSWIRPNVYRDHIKDKTITPGEMARYLNTHQKKHLPRWSTVFDEEKQHTVLKRGKSEVGRFLHGANAFEKQEPTGTEREVYRKKWGGLRTDTGSQKEFVQDDFGNFTRRYAYRIDTEDFYNQIMTQDKTFTGKHFRNRKTEEGTAPDFLQISPYEARLSGKIGDVELRDRERTEIGKRKVLGQEMINDNAALFFHQFLGNNDSQRGASLTSTPRGIVGNTGEGFGVEKDGQKRVKFKLDLANVPRREVGEAPNLFNYNASVMGSKGINPTGLEEGRGRAYGLESSVTKNREVFLRTVDKRMVVGTVPMKSLDTKEN